MYKTDVDFNIPVCKTSDCVKMWNEDCVGSISCYIPNIEINWVYEVIIKCVHILFL